MDAYRAEMAPVERAYYEAKEKSHAAYTAELLRARAMKDFDDFADVVLQAKKVYAEESEKLDREYAALQS